MLSFAEPLSFAQHEKIKDALDLLEMDRFIKLPHSENEISSVAVSQSLFFKILDTNPSYFKSKEYCPRSYKEINGVNLCLDFPVEGVAWQSSGHLNSAEEFFSSFNTLLENAGFSFRFRAPNVKEYLWAAQLDQVNKDDLWQYLTYNEVSNLDPCDLGRPSPSRFNQTHAIKAKLHNALGFYRSSVSEWTTDNVPLGGESHYLVGSSWDSFKSIYNKSIALLPEYSSSDVGIRMVRIPLIDR